MKNLSKDLHNVSLELDKKRLKVLKFFTDSPQGFCRDFFMKYLICEVLNHMLTISQFFDFITLDRLCFWIKLDATSFKFSMEDTQTYTFRFVAFLLMGGTQEASVLYGNKNNRNIQISEAFI
jgi:hypothetical protein